MPPKVTAGLARSRVSGYSRSPAPPASKTPSVSFIRNSALKTPPSNPYEPLILAQGKPVPFRNPPTPFSHFGSTLRKPCQDPKMMQFPPSHSIHSEYKLRYRVSLI